MGCGFIFQPLQYSHGSELSWLYLRFAAYGFLVNNVVRTKREACVT